MTRAAPPRVHPTALVESDCIGEGTVVWAFAHVMPGAVVGRHCKIGDHVFIEDGVTLGDHVTVKNGVAIWKHVHVADRVFLGPNAVLSNDRYPRSDGAPWQPLDTWIEEGVTVGANATIVCGVRLGRRALIAAGAVVTRDVPAHALMVGNPARQQGWVCHCGQPLGESGSTAACPTCGRKYRLSEAAVTEHE
ncbi:MAG TPA: acyltransferase [Methylomirabilota bacterium]|jgi:acetyltransferase-like isoleucine patch superfamily enzyme|nr:acyltransferase [Methylomirabilota bacterium]